MIQRENSMILHEFYNEVKTIDKFRFVDAKFNDTKFVIVEFHFISSR